MQKTIQILDGYVSPITFVLAAKLNNRPDYVQVQVMVNEKEKTIHAAILNDYVGCTDEEKKDVLDVTCQAIKSGDVLLPNFIPFDGLDEELSFEIDESWNNRLS